MTIEINGPRYTALKKVANDESSESKDHQYELVDPEDEAPIGPIQCP